MREDNFPIRIPDDSGEFQLRAEFQRQLNPTRLEIEKCLEFSLECIVSSGVTSSGNLLEKSKGMVVEAVAVLKREMKGMWRIFHRQGTLFTS